MSLLLYILLISQTVGMSTKKPSANSPTKQPFDALAKVAVIGDSSVGKTNILLRYVNSEYQLTHITTIGIDFKVKTLVLDGFRLKMQIWDTAGQQRFRNLSGTIYQGAEAIILVYSIASRKSFQNVEKWIKDISDKAHGSILLAIVGNKCDLQDEREVSKEEGMQIAKKFNAQIFLQTSAKDNINVDQLFEQVGKKIKQRLVKTDIPKKVQPKDSKMETKARSITTTTDNRQTQKQQAATAANNGKVKLTAADAKEKKKKSCC